MLPPAINGHRHPIFIVERARHLDFLSAPAAQRLALHTREEAQRSGIGCKRVVGGIGLSLFATSQAGALRLVGLLIRMTCRYRIRRAHPQRSQGRALRPVENPLPRPTFVAWPPPGYLPWPVAYPRWSLSYPQADFTAATVTMGGPGGAVAVVVQPVVSGYGENTLVWEPQGVLTLDDPAPAQDVSYSVTVSNIKWNGQTLQFSYQVTIFDPFK